MLVVVCCVLFVVYWVLLLFEVFWCSLLCVVCVVLALGACSVLFDVLRLLLGACC